jgi:hypothetical protein
MRGIKLTIVLKQKFPVGEMAPLAPPCGRPCSPEKIENTPLPLEMKTYVYLFTL